MGMNLEEKVKKLHCISNDYKGINVAINEIIIYSSFSHNRKSLAFVFESLEIPFKAKKTPPNRQGIFENNNICFHETTDFLVIHYLTTIVHAIIGNDFLIYISDAIFPKFDILLGKLFEFGTDYSNITCPISPKDIIDCNINEIDKFDFLERFPIESHSESGAVTFLGYNDDSPYLSSDSKHGCQGSGFGKYSGTYAQDIEGLNDDFIDDALGGEPDAYWNID